MDSLLIWLIGVGFRGFLKGRVKKTSTREFFYSTEISCAFFFYIQYFHSKQNLHKIFSYGVTFKLYRHLVNATMNNMVTISLGRWRRDRSIHGAVHCAVTVVGVFGHTMYMCVFLSTVEHVRFKCICKYTLIFLKRSYGLDLLICRIRSFATTAS